ncbi:glycosyltransferase family 2 protein [Marinomonas sp. TI.3.20]|uniref:glycosyltransferase family 2 protein n=1 Tax=Marinomonas sp. TI.3.20 TaxID=3121296 RepID=UPI00311E169E
MPVYNSSLYLDESISSVINQKHENWELICIDDGSTDSSLNILKSYETKFSNIVVLSQENSGPAQARKLGISISNGDYIAYLDADDAYSEDYLYETLKKALETDADVIMPKLIASWNGVDGYDFNKKNSLNVNNEILPKTAFLRTFPWSVHGLNLYKAEHIKKYALTEISDVNNFNADEYLTRYLLLYANRIIVSDGCYFYRSNEGSITQVFSLRHLGAIDVDELLFSLALKESFPREDLVFLSNSFYRHNAIMKYNIIKNKKNIYKKDFKQALVRMKVKRLWYDYVKFDGVKSIIAFFILNSSPFFLCFLIYIREKINSLRGGNNSCLK